MYVPLIVMLVLALAGAVGYGYLKKRLEERIKNRKKLYEIRRKKMTKAENLLDVSSRSANLLTTTGRGLAEEQST